jgi:hypothetical protein
MVQRWQAASIFRLQEPHGIPGSRTNGGGLKNGEHYEGWIRVRHQGYRNGDRWLFEFSIIRDALDPIRHFVTEGLRGGLLFPASPIELHGSDDHYFKYYSWREGSASAFVEESSSSK